ncbi:amidase [Comamonas sp. GB3 AK4-5]|uniref:amidase n=1 Tax=Comamonas sp. GB3 AK4-5 TaxID=3231487 RepID=UPI00351DBF36
MHTITDLLRQLDKRQTSAIALLEASQQQAQHSADLNALAHVDWDAAMATASACDAAMSAGKPRGALHGIPLSIKDLYPVRGMPTRAGTRATLPTDAQPQATNEALLVSRLRAAGAVLFAKANMHEIALGSTGENVWTGDVKNPFHSLHQAGGSSSGSGVAVACGMGLASVGSDTGGSVRIPANFSGVTGFKPTHGAIPLDGALPLSWTCDHAGPLAHSVQDCALLFEVMAARSLSTVRIARTPRFAIPATWLRGRLSTQVREQFEHTCARLAALGAQLFEVATPRLSQASQCFTDIVQAEAAWVHRDALAQNDAGFSELVTPSLARGRTLSASTYIDALQTRAAIAEELDAVLAGCDALLLPTACVLPPLRGQTEVQVESGSMTVREAVLGQTLPFSLVGVPALTIPTGLVDGLPVSLQVVAARGADDALLQLGQWLQAQVGQRLAPPSAMA